ncbi:phenylpropionate dioxygenase-like ring-hydroxylating dioxygenase large terminal subunit [Paraburkholderia sp. GAS206C]|jgi:phenylpropionate dioxygenase-like ring-hydroxylating dioxygenase large terminal subunit|uniref:Rieske 2Fe-2S domain-containing protein n=1 Tax=unclassified Paraburkholderia TaxID=2615204 RepID=UPI003D255008
MTYTSDDRKGWELVCQSAEVAQESALGRVVQARRLVVWRDAEGNVHVWRDHCPHRGAELSQGRVSGGLIACPEHGWRFDVNGQVIRRLTTSNVCIEGARAMTYDAKEIDGGVWACLDGGD